ENGGRGRGSGTSSTDPVVDPTAFFKVAGSLCSDFDFALISGDACGPSLRRCAFRRCRSQPNGSNKLPRYLSYRKCNPLNRKKSPEDCSCTTATPAHSATATKAPALSQRENRLLVRMCKCSSALHRPPNAKETQECVFSFRIFS